MIQLDEIDRSIVDIVSVNGRARNSEIAESIGVSEGTVRNRIQRMVDQNVLSFVGVLNPFQTDLITLALVGLHVDVREIENIANKLREFKVIRFLVACSGAFDLMMEVGTNTHDELIQFVTNDLAGIPGILHVKVSYELKLYKNAFNFLKGDKNEKNSQMDVADSDR